MVIPSLLNGCILLLVFINLFLFLIVVAKPISWARQKKQISLCNSVLFVSLC
jgi:hypothetical protein